MFKTDWINLYGDEGVPADWHIKGMFQESEHYLDGAVMMTASFRIQFPNGTWVSCSVTHLVDSSRREDNEF